MGVEQSRPGGRVGTLERPADRLEPQTGRASEPDRAREGVRIGVIADTHGLLRPEALEAFEGVSLILHAGDVGSPGMLTDLETVAPVMAVWGNVDGWDVRDLVAETASGEVAGLRWAMAHGHQVQPDYERLIERFPGAGLVVHGHTHEPSLRRVGSTLLLNPGAAGPKRFDKPVTVAVVEVGDDGGPSVRHVDLATGDTLRLS